MTQNNGQCKCKIDTVQTTSDTLTSRGGLSLFVRYVQNILLYPHLERLFGGIRKSNKGQSMVEIFKQLFCFFLDGTSRHLVYFDTLKEDAGYAAAIETERQALLSSHSVKRFFKAFSWFRIWLFRGLLQQLFLWRLKLAQPKMVELGIDTMVMDNDEANRRHGVEPTYKKVKGIPAPSDDMGKIHDRCGLPGREKAQQSWEHGRKDGSPHCGQDPQGL